MADNEWSQPDAPPPPLFTGKKEKDFVKQVTDEVIERIVGQGVFYYPISVEHTEFHEVYGEAITKTFLPPIRVYALIEWSEFITETGKFGVDRRRAITIHFHKKRLTEDQDLYVREGDFVKYGDLFYEIVSLSEPQQLFGQTDTKVEIVAKCIRAREGKFNAK
jgi:phenylpropionate dioxygenase-like ring-hydroxylating dioxygenase large terminal subunit